MMKKLLCLALALTLLLSACAFAVAEEDTGFAEFAALYLERRLSDCE